MQWYDSEWVRKVVNGNVPEAISDEGRKEWKGRVKVQDRLNTNLIPFPRSFAHSLRLLSFKFAMIRVWCLAASEPAVNKRRRATRRLPIYKPTMSYLFVAHYAHLFQRFWRLHRNPQQINKSAGRLLLLLPWDRSRLQSSAIALLWRLRIWNSCRWMNEKGECSTQQRSVCSNSCGFVSWWCPAAVIILWFKCTDRRDNEIKFWRIKLR